MAGRHVLTPKKIRTRGRTAHAGKVVSCPVRTAWPDKAGQNEVSDCFKTQINPDKAGQTKGGFNPFLVLSVRFLFLGNGQPDRARIGEAMEMMMHEYLKRIAQAQAKGNLPVVGVNHMTVAHDDWCGIHRGRECRCDPEIVFLGDDAVVAIGKDGNVLSREVRS